MKLKKYWIGSVNSESLGQTQFGEGKIISGKRKKIAGFSTPLRSGRNDGSVVVGK
jgi:hypothetical protein